MGHFEKIVVLIAITCVTVILAVTFSEDGDKTLQLSMEEGTASVTSINEPSPNTTPTVPKREELASGGGGEQDINPRSREGERGGPTFSEVEPVDPRTEVPEFTETIELASTKQAVPSGLIERSKKEQEQQARSNKGELFLDDSFATKGAGRDAAKLPAGAALKTLDGLRTTFDETLMEYTWREGDSMTSVAKKLYGSTGMSALLRQFNEDREWVPAGDVILVPIFDGRDATDRTRASDAVLVPRSELSEARGTLYTVAEGDSLWEISKKVYGKGSLWKQILDANTDVLKSAELIQTGMELRIP